MPYYKSPDNKVHWLDDAAYERVLPTGSVQITDEEADVLRPPPMPVIPSVVTMRQARLALLGAGLLPSVNDAIANMAGAQGDAARIEWEFSNEVKREQPLVIAMKPLLGLNDEQLDQLFTTASQL